MSKLEILVATMNQNDLSLIKKMNINTNCIIANQNGTNKYIEKKLNGKTIKMISSSTKGVGINRNIALLYSTADILLFSDDDMVYEDDVEEKVLKAFDELPQADIIIFGVRFYKNNKLKVVLNNKTKKLSLFNSLKYGNVSIAIRRNSFLKNKLFFSQLFGGGSLYCHGEDSDLIVNCYRKGLKLYTYNYVIGNNYMGESTWFNGYDEKYYYDTGALAKHTFKLFANLYIFYIAIRTKKMSQISFFNELKQLFRGKKNFNKLKKF